MIKMEKNRKLIVNTYNILLNIFPIGMSEVVPQKEQMANKMHIVKFWRQQSSLQHCFSIQLAE